MDPVELEVNRLNTAAFIQARPVSIVLMRGETVRTPSGGTRVVDPLPRPAQTFRLIEQGAAAAPQIITTTDGTARQVNFQMLGLHDADVKVNDTWIEDGRDWRVGDIVRSNGYETRALVVENGG